jgi:hypothetical protein
VDDLRQGRGRSGLGVKIWEANATRSAPELHRHADRAVNDLGPSASNGGMPVLNTSTRTRRTTLGSAWTRSST